MQAQDKLNDIKSRRNKQAAMFIGHGSPTVAIEFDDWNDKLCTFVEGIPHPASIVIISGHWETEGGIKITSSLLPHQIYDFSEEDYPETLFSLTYPVEGNPELAMEIADMLQQRGHKVDLDDDAGLDSGTWVPLYVTFPNVDVPVIEISLPKGATPEKLLDIGRILAPLRKRGVLLIGSGNIVNNKDLSEMEDKYADTDPWAMEFDHWFAVQLHEMNIQNLLDYKNQAPHADKAVANTNHILPLFFVLGALQQNDYYVTLFEGFHYGNISMRSFALVGNP